MTGDDPFALLGLARQFQIDRDALQAAFLRQSAAVHPDRFTDPIRQAEAAEEAARLNDARALLLDDERRANALLRLLGGPAKEQDDSLPDGFLIDIMEVRQAMEEALAHGDESERQPFEQWAQQRRLEYHQHVAGLFDLLTNGQLADDQSRSEALGAIRTQLNAWRYIERMIEQINPA